jgi:hypothetical protein
VPNGDPLGSGGSLGIQTNQDFYAQYGPLDFSGTHRFTTAFSYDLPFGKGRPLLTQGGILSHILPAIPAGPPGIRAAQPGDQRRRDRKHRLQHLVKNNLALDLKHSAAEVWLLGPAALHLAKNNLAVSHLLIVQRVSFNQATPVAS